MCTNCLTHADAVLANVAVTAGILQRPARRFLAGLGLVEPFDPVARDVRTVSFLRSLDLDPREILGDTVVTRADARAGAEEDVAHRGTSALAPAL